MPSQTPLFWALEKDRYLRQSWIREIEEQTGRRLVAYVANFNHPQSAIGPDDIPPFPDLLHDIDPQTDLDLLIHSPGGDIDAAERLVYMCRKRSGSLRVIVPSSAKSAATLIAIAADSIVMGFVSELGPIDPQLFVTTPSGESMWRPAQSFLDGLESIKQETDATGVLSPVYYPLLDKLDPALTTARRRSNARRGSPGSGWRRACARAMGSRPNRSPTVSATLTSISRTVR